MPLARQGGAFGATPSVPGELSAAVRAYQRLCDGREGRAWRHLAAELDRYAQAILRGRERTYWAEQKDALPRAFARALPSHFAYESDCFRRLFVNVQEQEEVAGSMVSDREMEGEELCAAVRRVFADDLRFALPGEVRK